MEIESTLEKNVEVSLQSAKTTYGPIEELSPEQLSAMWDRFPYIVQKSLNRTKKGLLSEVTKEELSTIHRDYLDGTLVFDKSDIGLKEDGNSVECSTIESDYEIPDGEPFHEIRNSKRQHIE